MTKNVDLELAWDFVEKTNRNIFLTGKAGTGKTTFLRKIKNQSMKRLVVVAPTGVAAINAKGVTIHSFFQMPFGPILPDDLENSNSSFQQKFNRTKIDIIKSLDLLVIDEISMVRADLLDGIDQVLRRYKNRDKVFGGVQVLMIGDLQQLAPVIKPSDWTLLKAHYPNAYFFSSHAFKQSDAIGIELRHIYRQDDEKFIKILNEIRTNKLSTESADILNERFDPNFEPKKEEEYIILTTHNNKADTMNNKEFDKLDSKTKTYHAVVKDKFPEHAYPCEEKLNLKVGTQVMFTKNDSSPEKRYFNGKIGEVIKLSNDEVTVKCHDNSKLVVTPETWENLSYSINANSKEIEEKVEGSFTQIPLKLAWAITIHKSQGLTFERAIIDAGHSFAHGQTYVALSRCKTLEGIVLKTKIQDSSIINDQRVESFTQAVENNHPDEKELNNSEKMYQLSLIEDLFNYLQFSHPTLRLQDIFYKNEKRLQGNLLETITTLKTSLEKLLPISRGFNSQLLKLSQDISNPEKDDAIQERINKGIDYFLEFTETNIEKPLKDLTFKTENKAVQKDIQNQVKILKDHLKIKLRCLKGVSKPFSTSKYLELRAMAVLQDMKPERSAESFEKTTQHPVLLESLRNYRQKAATAAKVEIPQVFTQRSLYEMSNALPCTPKQLGIISGMGKTRIDNYGKGILEIIVAYCNKKKIPLTKDTIELDKPKKGSSQYVTLEMFNKNMSVKEIADERDMVIGTIESHLSQFVATGEIKATQLMDEAKYEELKKIMKETEYEGFGELKSKIDEKFTYGDLRVAAKGIEFEESQK